MVLPSSFGASCPSPNPHSPRLLLPECCERVAGVLHDKVGLSVWAKGESVNGELHSSPESAWDLHELSVYNVWENFGATIVLTQMLKGVRISTRATYR